MIGRPVPWVEAPGTSWCEGNWEEARIFFYNKFFLIYIFLFNRGRQTTSCPLLFENTWTSYRASQLFITNIIPWYQNTIFFSFTIDHIKVFFIFSFSQAGYNKWHPYIYIYLYIINLKYIKYCFCFEFKLSLNDKGWER